VNRVVLEHIYRGKGLVTIPSPVRFVRRLNFRDDAFRNTSTRPTPLAKGVRKTVDAQREHAL